MENVISDSISKKTYSCWIAITIVVLLSIFSCNCIFILKEMLFVFKKKKKEQNINQTSTGYCFTGL